MGRDPAARAGAAGRMTHGTGVRPSSTPPPTRRSPPTSSATRDSPWERRDAAREQLLPRPAALRRRHLQGDRRRPRTHGAARPRPARHPRDPLHLPDRATALGAGRRADRRGRGRDLPALLEYQGMLMGEPLAATLLSGSVLAIAVGGGLRGQVAMAAARRRSSELWHWSGRSTSACRCSSAWSCFARNGRAGWRTSLAPAAPTARRRGGDRRALDGAQRGRARPRRADLHRGRPGPLRRHLPAFRRRSRNESEQRWSNGIPNCSGPTPSNDCGWSRSWRGLAHQRYPRAGNRRGALEDGQGTALGRHQRRAARIRRFRRDQGLADLVARPAGGDARARLEALALGASRLRPARPRRARPASGAGRRC